MTGVRQSNSLQVSVVVELLCMSTGHNVRDAINRSGIDG